jgi:hypothetical protein
MVRAEACLANTHPVATPGRRAVAGETALAHLAHTADLVEVVDTLVAAGAVDTAGAVVMAADRQWLKSVPVMSLERLIP